MALPSTSLVKSSAVLYHYPCPDGVFAALAAHCYHKSRGLKVKFIPNTVYSPKRVEDLDTESFGIFYLLDFAGPSGFAESLAKKAERVIVLDHHKTALENLPTNGKGPPNLLCILDMDRSGATISYDFFSRKLQEFQHTSKISEGISSSALPETNAVDISRDNGSTDPLCEISDRETTGEFLVSEEEDRIRVEKLFAYIEDADLWKWRLQDSKSFSSGLKDMELEYSFDKNSEIFDQLLSLNPTDLIRRGTKTLAEKQLLIDKTLETAFVIRLGNGQFGSCLAVEAEGVANIRSELGNQLAEKSREIGLRGIGAVVYREEGMEDVSQLKISLRSIGDDTTEISKAYGGGGHQKASSFLLNRNMFLEWHDRKSCNK